MLSITKREEIITGIQKKPLHIFYQRLNLFILYLPIFYLNVLFFAVLTNVIHKKP
jgi:hypothetical protein